MIKLLENHGPAIEEDQIAELEAELGTSLPRDYRQFMLKHNGGTPTPNTVDVSALPGSPTDLQVFFSVDNEGGTNNVYWNLELIRERLPSQHLLPIACDSGGNIFCLKFAKRGVAEVVYCNLEDLGNALFTVAPTFSHFLDNLREFHQ
jgi:cell wall assembly regulator SMI1